MAFFFAKAKEFILPPNKLYFQTFFFSPCEKITLVSIYATKKPACLYCSTGTSK